MAVIRLCGEPLELFSERRLMSAGVLRLLFAHQVDISIPPRITRALFVDLKPSIGRMRLLIAR